LAAPEGFPRTATGFVEIPTWNQQFGGKVANLPQEIVILTVNRAKEFQA